tara:strand:- start:606 stop:1814 length:1209 start_codon:yes stop_codon:yes gene_type:complete
MGARHYDSSSGRFLSPDPLGHTATPDLYSYALGDPINFFDPTGRMGTGFHKQNEIHVDGVLNNLATGGIMVGADLYKAGTKRLEYDLRAEITKHSKVASTSDLKIIRNDLKYEYRTHPQNTLLGDAYVNNVLKKKKDSGKIDDYSKKTNSGSANKSVTNVGKVFKSAGRGLLVTSTAIDAYGVYSAPEGEKLVETSRVGGRLAGGYVGAKLFGASSSWTVNPWIVGGSIFVGGVIGSIGGEELVNATINSLKEGSDFDRERDLHGVSVCFASGTFIDTPSGIREIQTLLVGEEVWGYDHKSDKRVKRKILRTLNRMSPDYYEIQIEDEIIKVTGEHPFWVDGLGYTPVRELSNESLMLNASGSLVPLTQSILNKESITVYNITVEGTHNYFVGQNKILVHNK